MIRRNQPVPLKTCGTCKIVGKRFGECLWIKSGRFGQIVKPNDPACKYYQPKIEKK